MFVTTSNLCFSQVESAFGPATLFWEPDATRLRGVRLPNGFPSTKDAETLTEVPAAARPAWVQRIATAVALHLAGEVPVYDLAWLELEGLTPFRRRVSELVFRIPPGETCTYGEVAKAVGSPGAARAVGATMANNPFPVIIPCHRVVGTTGLVGFGGGLPLKRQLLDLEAQMSGLFATPRA